MDPHAEAPQPQVASELRGDEVTQLAVEGLSPTAIAARLQISCSGVFLALRSEAEVTTGKPVTRDELKANPLRVEGVPSVRLQASNAFASRASVAANVAKVRLALKV